MVQIDTKTPLEKFRHFIILNTCASYIPSGYLHDETIFPERDSKEGTIYVEAASKIELKQMRDVKFVKVADVLGVIYRSKSGNTDLRWRQTRGNFGRLVGEASPNSVVNLLEAGILGKDFVRKTLDEFKTRKSSETGGEQG
ncbi:hypothetical protein HRbin01_00188 [archaeon HR01]|nr:hypothetical protein HRbin01_00188 [archaeon HR01]